ncbi:MAG: ABC transporter permease subunit [Deltaproteobacteria bacterium]|nr:ABC transporter permease subunit [Deltaproteobacteria bacterium]MBW1924101.1 ABC transporter permease subunit [Deltaproteobacteria bacterium]MBW1950543.1 ABC transporter permease subunit [Deltaproteobacteria bacterium]MBW2007562.1 ABC transporter permease subunit [Deltaproteobacteria bacterium]MBW2346826.1 ABC transporter permease subunit [Deltaproteobacteria bacterium]
MKRFLRNSASIIKRELDGYFQSPVAYVFIVIFLLLCGFFTFSVSRFFETGQADLRAFFEWHPWIFLFLVPAVAMRLWAEERRTGTIELVLTLPITLTEVIMGKFLAAWVFIGLGLVLTFPLVITVCYLGEPDLGAVFCAYFGSFLLAGAYLGVGSMTSSLTRNQVISFILSVMICLFLVLAGWPPVTDALSDWAPIWLVDVVAGFGFMPHFASLQRGVVDVRDLFYFVSVIFFMLFTNAVILQNRRTS